MIVRHAALADVDTILAMRRERAVKRPVADLRYLSVRFSERTVGSLALRRDRQGTADGVHIFTVQPAPQFCANPAISDNRKNRYDGVHFLGPGAAIYFNAIIPQLLTLPS